MAFKLIVALVFATIISVEIVPAQHVFSKQAESYDAHPKYQFSYAVNDEHTGDVKSQVESRDGDVVHGEYSVIDADGYKRVVHYSADHDHGFNAVVQREPLKYGVKAAAPAPAPVVHATAPALFKSAPSAYAATPTHATSYASQSLNKNQKSYTSQSFAKTAPVVHAAKPVQTSYLKQSSYKPVPKAYSSQSIKTVPSSYGGRSSHY